MSAALTSEEQEKLDGILAGFTAKLLPRPQVALGYRFGLSAVATAMVLLLMLYFGIVVLFVRTILGATHPPELRNWEPTRGVPYWALGRSTVLIVAGSVVVLFMVRPFFKGFSPPELYPSAIPLNPEDEPLFHAFVREVARTVGAPVPTRIEVDCSVNAGTECARWGQDLKLVVGLPLVAGLDLRAFGGALAHELGHFSQTAGMRMSREIQQVNLLFYRAVYERHAWDRELWDPEAHGKGWIAFLACAAAVTLVLTRAVLWVFMVIGHGISCFALRQRQREFNADAYQVQFAGSDAFDRTMRRLELLNVGSEMAHQSVEINWQARLLPRDFPGLVRAHADFMSREEREAIEKAMESEPALAFASHPTHIERIRAARKSGVKGIFRNTGPATLLFRRYDLRAREASERYYRDDLGLHFDESNLVDNAALRPMALRRVPQFQPEAKR